MAGVATRGDADQGTERARRVRDHGIGRIRSAALPPGIEAEVVQQRAAGIEDDVNAAQVVGDRVVGAVGHPGGAGGVAR